MRDETLVEPFAVPEIFVDGFSDHVITNGVMTCAGYRIQPAIRGDGEAMKVVVIRLVMPAANIDEAIEDARQAQSSPVVVKNGKRLARH